MNNYYSEKLIEEIRASNDIVSVIGEYIQLKKKGKYFFGVCPFHPESNASFSVTPGKQMFYCFSCGRGGSVIQFIMHIEGLSFSDAVKFLANKAKIEMPEEDEQIKKQQQHKARILKINALTANFFFTQLISKKNNNAVQYLKKRNVDGDVIKKFGIGYSPNEWDLLYNYLKSKGIEQQDILDSGLTTVTKKGNTIDRFKNRIMFPIFNIVGEIIGFGGRTIDSSLPKYINSPETIVYSKGNNLYGLNFAKTANSNDLIIVEGYMDVISLHKHGITNVIASMGTALTEQQGRLLRRYANRIIIAFDTDSAGQAATLKGLDLLYSMGCNVNVLIIPNGKDPDEYINNFGKDRFENLVKNSISLVEYKVRSLKNSIDTSTTEGSINFLNKTASILANVKNEIEREVYLKKLSQEYGITEQSLNSEICKKIAKINFKLKPSTRVKITQGGSHNYENFKNKNTYDQNIIAYYERILLILLCMDNTIYDVIINEISEDDFSDEYNKTIADIVFKKIKNNESLQVAELINNMDDPHISLFTKDAYENCNFDNNIKAAIDIVKRLQREKSEKRKKEILHILSNNYDTMCKDEIQQLKQELNDIMMQKEK